MNKVNFISILRKYYVFIIVSFQLFGCNDNYEFQLEKGVIIDKQIIKYTKKVIPVSKKTIFIIEIPHKEDIFIKRKLIVQCNEDFEIQQFENFNSSVLSMLNDTLFCYLHTNEKKSYFDFVPLKYHDKIISGQEIISNSIITSFRFINHEIIELKTKKCSSDLYYNFKIENGRKLDSTILKKYNVEELRTVKISEIVFSSKENEIELINLRGSKENIERLIFSEDLKVTDILIQILKK